MRSKRSKFLGIAIVLVSFLIASFNSIYITSPSILDTDPGTYIIVVMLMLFLFIIFSAKEDLEFRYSGKNIALGIALFAAYLIAMAYSRVALSFLFASYRIDALLFPLLLLSIVIVVFGVDGARKLLPVIVYAAFASPLLLVPVLNLNGAFANLNALGVYGFIKAIGAPASISGLVISSKAASSITISTTCVSLGTFIALVMLLLPLAYLFNGPVKRKLYWISTGIILMLALNILRMLSIAYVWVYYGIGGALGIFHAFAGQLIFYIAIIAMVLLANRYGMEVGAISKGTIKGLHGFYAVKDRRACLAVVAALAFALVSLYFSTGYNNMVRAPSTLLGNAQISQATANRYALSSIRKSGGAVVDIGGTPNGEAYALANAPSINSTVFAIVNTTYEPGINVAVSNYSSVSPRYYYLLNDGITVAAQTVSSHNSTFVVNYFTVPRNISGAWVPFNYLLFYKASPGKPASCSMAYSSITLPNIMEYSLYDIIKSGAYAAGAYGLLCQSYLIAS